MAKKPKRNVHGEFSRVEGASAPSAKRQWEDIREQYRASAQKHLADAIAHAESLEYEYEEPSEYVAQKSAGTKMRKLSGPGTVHEFTSWFHDEHIDGYNTTPAGRIIEGEHGHEYYFAPQQDTSRSTRWQKVSRTEWHRLMKEQPSLFEEPAAETAFSAKARRMRDDAAQRVREQREEAEAKAARTRGQVVAKSDLVWKGERMERVPATVAKPAPPPTQPMGTMRQAGVKAGLVRKPRKLREAPPEVSRRTRELESVGEGLHRKSRRPGSYESALAEEAVQHMTDRHYEWQGLYPNGDHKFKHASGATMRVKRDGTRMTAYGEWGQSIARNWNGE
jgi:hypothetical protein